VDIAGWDSISCSQTVSLPAGLLWSNSPCRWLGFIRFSRSDNRNRFRTGIFRRRLAIRPSISRQGISYIFRLITIRQAPRKILLMQIKPCHLSSDENIAIRHAGDFRDKADPNPGPIRLFDRTGRKVRLSSCFPVLSIGWAVFGSAAFAGDRMPRAKFIWLRASCKRSPNTGDYHEGDESDW